jgi:AraC family transcriptional regulator
MAAPLLTGGGALGGAVVHATEIAGFVYSNVRIPPRMRLPRHAHSRANLLVVLSGSYTETIDRRTTTSAPMTAIVKPPGQEHGNTQRDEAARCLLVEVTDGRLTELRDGGAIFEQTAIVRGGSVGAFALRAGRELAAPDTATPLVLEALALEMIADATRSDPYAAEAAPPSWLAKVREILHDSPTFPGLSALGRSVGRHPVHVARAFRLHFGCTVGDYARRLRVERAERALLTSDRSLAEIAVEAGFCDQSHLSKALRRHTEMSPMQLRLTRGRARR